MRPLPQGKFTRYDIMYQRVRANVDMTKVIQIGLTFSDWEGNFPNGNPTWQFNFKFTPYVNALFYF